MHSHHVPIYQTEQIRKLEQLAIERFDISADTMMHRAGKSACDFLLRKWPHVKKIAVFCGTGNNGGDGFVLAHQAKERGLHVTVWQLGDLAHIKPEAKIARDQCLQSGVTFSDFNDTCDFEHPDLIVDSILGIGLQGELKGEMISAIQRINRQSIPILSIDVPSGIDADNGQVLGAAIRATATITFIGLKLGLLTGHGSAHTGELAHNDLQLPFELFSLVEPKLEKIPSNFSSSFLKPRPKDWHKGLSGHVLVVGGDFGFSGAPCMAAVAALRVGAGLVSVATREEHAKVLNATHPEIMSHGIHDAAGLKNLLEKADMVILGPGLGQSDWSRPLWQAVIQTDLPIVLDADGLNILSEQTIQLDHWVLTPHPGEAARLLHGSAASIQKDRLSAIQQIQKQYGGVIVLKGAGTLIGSPNSKPSLCDKGNPGMASAGMGDVLSGVIGGLMAQKIPMAEAAKLGVLLHAQAGDLAAKEGERGMIATDLMPYLRRLVNPV